MNFEPQKFFIGLMDFFSIFLPGALLTYMKMDALGPIVLQDRYAALAGAEAWAVFLFSSYFLGHLVFLLGSFLDRIYDWLRARTLDHRVALVARRGKLHWPPTRICVSLVFKRESSHASNRAFKLKEEALTAVRGKDAINAFQWSKALLTMESPQSMVVVQRLEADSKFFRCFTIVLLLLLVPWPRLFRSTWSLESSIVTLFLLVPSLWRYMEQRHKAINQAYWSVITLVARNSKISSEESESMTSSPTQVTCAVFRVRRGQAKYLLLEAKDEPAKKVLPGGTVAHDEQDRAAAVRGVYEETGVWAQIVHDFGFVSTPVNGTDTMTHFFLMKAIGRGLRKDRARWLAWMDPLRPDARDDLTETRDLIEAAEQQRLQALSRSRQDRGTNSDSS